MLVRTSAVSRRDCRGGRERGATMVEFALILPVFLLLVLGIIEFGNLYNTQISLTGAAREGVRVMAIQKDVDAARTATATAASLPVSALTIEVEPNSNTCPATTNATVTVTRVVPLISPILGPDRTFTLSGVGVMRCGG